MNKYKKLKDSNFKTKFLVNISGTIEENLVASLRSDVVRFSYLFEKKTNIFDNFIYYFQKHQNDRTKNMFLKNELLAKRKNPKYRSMFEVRKKLPSYRKKNEILELIRNNQVILISGETGKQYYYYYYRSYRSLLKKKKKPFRNRLWKDYANGAVHSGRRHYVRSRFHVQNRLYPAEEDKRCVGGRTRSRGKGRTRRRRERGLSD